MSPRTPRAAATRLATVTALVAAGLAAATAAGATDDESRSTVPRELARTADGDVTQVVKVAAPSVADRNEVIALGLDVTEHADKKGIEVVLHDSRDAQVLRDAGFTWTVTVDDLEALTKKNRKLDRAYAASVAESALPSGRTSYRQYADYLSDMDQLARTYPSLTKPLTLANKTVLGADIRGIEVTVGADRVADGKPVFLLMGAHHAREWPSAEHTMEFAFDLLQSYRAGDARARDLLSRSRVILVPVVNVDGFTISRGATPRGDFSQFDYEMKRKNCSISANTTPPSATVPDYRSGTCADNPAGRLRGTDLNRNYPGFWGGGGASPSWSSDTYRGDGPGSEPESDAVRQLISERAVTMMISNHTYSNLVLRPPAIAATGRAPDEPALASIGQAMADQNSYVNQASYQLYDTSGSTEDWSYWITGGYGYTFEIGDEGFHPAYEEAVVGEYLGEAPADSAGRGGNGEAYWIALDAAADPVHHSRITGTAPAKHTISVYKNVVSPTSPVIQPSGPPAAPILYEDTLTTDYASTGGAFTFDVNPSTRPLVVGRYGRQPQGPAQSPITLTNPAGVPAVGSSESTTFTVQGLPQADNGFANVSISWPATSDPEAQDWDFTVIGPDGVAVGSGATLSNPETIRIPDPKPGTYTVVADNYAGGTPEYDWSGTVTFEGPTPPIETGITEAWVLSCADKRGTVVSTQDLVIKRGQAVDVGNVCRRTKG
jgi:hypothetical protein